MEVDMRMFDCEMRLEDFDDYMFQKSSGNGEDAVLYNGAEHEFSSGHMEFFGIEDGSFYNACSPSLSRSSSQVSTESDSSLSLENYSPSPPRAAQTQSGGNIGSFAHLIDLWSPLSDRELIRARSCASSLQSFNTENSYELSMCDMAVHPNHEYGTSSQMGLSSMNAELSSNSSSLMDSMLDIGMGVLDDLPAVDDVAGQYEEWSSGTNSQQQHHHPGKNEIYGSSPVSVLQFGDEEEISPRAGDTTQFEFVSPQLHDDDNDMRHCNSTMPAPNVQASFDIPPFSHIGDETPSFSHTPVNGLQQLWRSERSGNNSNSNDLFHQHLSSQISFQNCHTPHEGGFQAHAVAELGIKSDEDLNGIRLVHLLLAGSEAVASSNVDLAAVILVRLKELVSRTGSTMQRVAAYFSEGLQYRIEGVKAPESSKAFEPHAQSDTLGAFQILHEVSPYIKFSHFTANQAILEAFEGERRVHIMDYDILEGIQWPSLMQALACRPGGPPHLRITALCRPHVKRALAMTQETGKRLTEFAASFNIPFSFHQVRVDSEDEFRPSLLKQVKGECLAVNCMLHLPHMPHRSKSPVASFMKIVHKLSPKVLTLVEDELSCSAPTFASHFFEALHHYSAIFDSLEATLSAESKGRQLVEKIFLAPRITTLITSSSSEGMCEMSEPVQWHSLAQAAGFLPVPMSVYNLCQAKLLLGLFSDGYKVEEQNNRLLLGWRSKILLGASVWKHST